MTRSLEYSEDSAVPERERRDSLLVWICRFLRDPNIASIAPSSSSAVRMICNCIDFTQVQRIAEFGPGSGVVTEEILRRMSAEARLLAFETNDDFVRELEQLFDDPRLRVLGVSAEEVQEVSASHHEQLDAIISGVPFSFFDDAKANRIIRGAAAALGSNGRFVIFQAHLPPFRTTRRLQRLLAPHFHVAPPQVVFKNLPPLEILVTQKRMPCSVP